jgi:hypothetical protein
LGHGGQQAGRGFTESMLDFFRVYSPLSLLTIFIAGSLLSYADHLAQALPWHRKSAAARRVHVSYLQNQYQKGHPVNYWSLYQLRAQTTEFMSFNFWLFLGFDYVLANFEDWGWLDQAWRGSSHTTRWLIYDLSDARGIDFQKCRPQI